MLKLTIPDAPDFYSALIAHKRVARVVALSGGYTRDDACKRLSANHGMIASFSRALVEDLRHSMSDAEFNAALGADRSTRSTRPRPSRFDGWLIESDVDHIVIASAAKQPRGRVTQPLGCFVASLLAMTICPSVSRSVLPAITGRGRPSEPIRHPGDRGVRAVAGREQMTDARQPDHSDRTADRT